MKGLIYQLHKKADKKYSNQSFGNDRNIFIEGGSYIIGLVKKYDNPIGEYWKCDSCNNSIFIPGTGCYKEIKYCPFCGEIITSFNDVGVCMDDSVIGTNLKRVK